MSNQVCPYCGQLLVKGFITAPQENFFFAPEGTAIPLFRTRWTIIEGTTQIRLFQPIQKSDMFKNVIKQTAHMCVSCKKVIIDF